MTLRLEYGTIELYHVCSIQYDVIILLTENKNVTSLLVVHIIQYLRLAIMQTVTLYSCRGMFIPCINTLQLYFILLNE